MPSITGFSSKKGIDLSHHLSRTLCIIALFCQKLITIFVYLKRLLDRIFLDITGLFFPFIQEGNFLFCPPTVSDWEKLWLDGDPVALPLSTVPSSVKSCSKIENYRFLNRCYHHQWWTDGRQKVL